VFVNYSQDLSTETYLKRTIGTRPAGLPEGAQFVTLTLVNIPGSVKYQVFGSKAGVQINTSLPVKDFLMDYVKAEAPSLSELPFLLIDEVEFLLTIAPDAENISNHYTYITPSGHPITLHANTRPSLTGRTNNTEANRLIPTGVLLGFKEGEEIYVAAFKKTANEFTFHGYKSAGSTSN
jgi:hypothetical protein